jgi:hypothetical protein
MNNFINTDQFQEMLINHGLSYSKANIYWWIRTLQLPARKVLRDYLIAETDALSFIEKLKERQDKRRGRKSNGNYQEG